MQTMEELFRLYYADLYRYLLFLTGNSQHAEDLLMETFLKAITAAGRFKGESTVKTWLFGIARNLWLQQLRKSRISQEELLLSRYWEIPLDEHIDRRELLAAIQRHLSEKSERERAIFSMRTEGYSYAEIAARLSISENSARVIEYRVRKDLTAKLEKEGFTWQKSNVK